MCSVEACLWLSAEHLREAMEETSPAWAQSRSWLPSMIMKGAYAVKGWMKLEKSSQMDR